MSDVDAKCVHGRLLSRGPGDPCIDCLLATIAARDEQLVLANGAYDNLEMTCGALRLNQAQTDAEVALLKAALRKFAVETQGSETDLYSRCRICGVTGKLREEPKHTDRCALGGDQ